MEKANHELWTIPPFKDGDLKKLQLFLENLGFKNVGKPPIWKIALMGNPPYGAKQLVYADYTDVMDRTGRLLFKIRTLNDPFIEEVLCKF